MLFYYEIMLIMYCYYEICSVLMFVFLAWLEILFSFKSPIINV